VPDQLLNGLNHRVVWFVCRICLPT